MSSSRDLPPESRQLEELRDRLRELAEGQRRLREELAVVLDLVDPGSGSEARRSRDAAAPAAAGAPSPSLARAAAKLVLRAPVTVLRRLRRGATADPPEPLTVELGSRPAAALPEIALVLPAEDEAATSAALERSSAPPEEIVVWDPGDGAYVVRDAVGGELRRGVAASSEELREALASDYVGLASEETLAGLGATALELVRLTLAGEPLDFLELPSGDGLQGGRLRLWRRRLWRPEEDARLGGALLGKVLGRAATPASPDAARWLEVGPYRLERRRGPVLRSRRHLLRPLRGLETAPATGPPSLALVAGAPLVADRDRLAADLLRAQSTGRRPVVFALAPSDDLQAERLRQLERLSNAVYPLSDHLAPELVPEAAALLARRHRVEAFLELGAAPAEVAAALARNNPEARRLELPAVEGTDDELLACGVDAEALGAADQEMGESLRRRLEIPAGAVLVAMTSDLYPRQRPEDFLALAHRLADDERFFFLLVGRGPLAGTLDDLERYLAPRRWRRLAEAPDAEVLAAADVALDTAEKRPLPYFVLSALAVGRPAVACAPGLRELLAAESCGLAAPAGEGSGLAEAVRRLADPELRAELGANGRRLVERRFTRHAVDERYRELLEGARGER